MAALGKEKIIAVIGAGTMGAGVAQVAAKAGHPVLLFDVAEGAATKGVERLSKGLDKLVARGRMTVEDQQALIARIIPVNQLNDLAASDLVIEAIVEKLEVKQALFRDLEVLCSKQTILASNTSSLSITAIGAALARPDRLVGMHFFNPAPVMKLVEVISGLATDAEVAETVFDTAEEWGKTAVHARSTPGFIVNRVARPFYAEALRVLEVGGANAATIDALIRDCGGFRMGPFELMDLIGHDVNYAVTCSVHAAYYGDQRFTPSLIQKELVDAGFLGRKSGRGFYDYREGAANPVSEISVARSCDAPPMVTLVGDAPYAATLIDMMNKAGIAVERETADQPDDFLIVCGEVIMAQTDGRLATQAVAEDGVTDLVVFDLALDYEKSTRIAIAAADQTSTMALDEAIGFWQALGKQVSVMDDIPGLCVMRTVCMLANEGADAVNQQVCSAEAVDIAMQNGVNYPQGPMAWADAIGTVHVATILDNLLSTYGEDRYRASPLLVRKAMMQGTFHEAKQ
jgi:3-hydroxybutyryl-CoA dehydrogenase